jgi:pSer/pThr/pTyr-binding forkhead associated (FHA) protein
MASGERGGAARLSATTSNDDMTDPTVALYLVLRPVQNKGNFIQRRIRFENGTVVPIGRASSTESKHLSEDPQNGFITCPVISRDHAKIECRTVNDCLKLYIRDLRSSHGTKINNIRLTREHELLSGDTIEFGTVIVRGSETFHPPKYVVEIDEFLKVGTIPKSSEISSVQKTPTSGFAVPESDESEDYSEEYSGDEGIHINSSPTSASTSGHNYLAKPASAVEIIASGNQLKSELLGTFELPGIQSALRPALEPNLADADPGNTSQTFYPPFSPTFDKPVSQMSKGLTRDNAGEAAPEEVIDETDEESDEMNDSRILDFDVEDSADECEISASPVLKQAAVPELKEISTTANWSFWDPATSGPASAPRGVEVLINEERPHLLPSLTQYQTGPFSLNNNKPAPAPDYFIVDTTAEAEDEYEPNEYDVPEALGLNGPQHITSFTNTTAEAANFKPISFVAYQPPVKSPLAKSMSIENIVNAENVGGTKRKLADVDGTAEIAAKISSRPDAGAAAALSVARTDWVRFCEEQAKELTDPTNKTTSGAEPANHPFEQTSPQEPQANAAAAADPAVDQDTANEQRARKRPRMSRTMSFVTGTAVGALLGGIGTVVGLASIPPDFFA